MTKPGRLEVGIYDAVLHIASTRKQWKKLGRELPNLVKIDATGMSQFVVYVPKRGNSVPHLAVYVDPRGLGVPALVNLIAHEADHTAGQLLDHIGETYDGLSEAHAYLVGWISEKVWQHLYRKGAKL